VDTKTHWEQIYQSKPTTEVSWYQARPDLSLYLIQHTGIDKASRIIDVGGGASTLVDHLLAGGFQNITVLDISGAALHQAQERLGPRAENIAWIEADITQAALPSNTYDLWHDRAVLHFLIDAESRRRYMAALHDAVKTDGHVILATFALDGPPRCSGLEVMRYSPEGLLGELGAGFDLVQSTQATHQTPSGGEQKFIYYWFHRR